MQRDKFEVMAERLRNWGRWGDDDMRGTLNHVGPEVLKRAAAEVRDGKMFTMGLPYDSKGPAMNTYRFNPMLYMMAIEQPLNPAHPAATYSDDAIHMPLQCSTQWDALAHVHYDGMIFNGCKTCDVLSENGAKKGGVEHMATPGVASRGVLIDVARHRKVDRLDKDQRITVDELNQVCAAQGTEVLPGDIVVVRTGHIRHFTVDGNKSQLHGAGPGLDVACAEWLHDKSAAAVCADNMAVEFMGPGVVQSEMPMPFHLLCLRDMGLPLGELFDLEALAADCAGDGRYSFMMSAPPLAFTGAAGSPVNPMAFK